MGLANRLAGSLLLSTVALVAGVPSAFAQDHAGIVTSLEGVAMVSRITLPEGRPLQFKDDVYVRDRIATGDRSLVRVLLGGKATVTARERSVLTITEIPGVSTVHLEEGRISVAVSKGLMKPGEVIEIKTPNAVSAIRGTVVVAEVLPGATVRSTISVLRGLVEVTRLDTGHQVGQSVHVGAHQAISVAGSKPLTQPHAITAADESGSRPNFEWSHATWYPARPPQPWSSRSSTRSTMRRVPSPLTRHPARLSGSRPETRSQKVPSTTIAATTRARTRETRTTMTMARVLA
jgi:hypothetical protein